ncbi:hypothetical protein PsorP6_013891 [Peronosclerospora sorghi]|uniref:Uncharacterized protein n=1 Tax=Peronosclerospora sorghi TaxID=230839 RepID=A0ACC0VH48_9STRA|nr:hypothetical protein PsorP6_013891 [Peronosclerospora sorghi]
MTMDKVDALDAYMASLEVPSNAPCMSMSQARAECTLPLARARGDEAMVVKNRRYRHLQDMLADPSVDRYFSDARMQERSPALFHFYLGQYVGMDQPVGPSVPPTDQTLSSFLLTTVQRREMEAQRVAEQAKWGALIGADEQEQQSHLQRAYDAKDVEDEDNDDDEEEEKDEQDVATRDTIDDMRQQLIEIMSARFLNGDDSDFVNYAEIDTNETLVDFVEMQRDAEERYFWGADGADSSVGELPHIMQRS